MVAQFFCSVCFFSQCAAMLVSVASAKNNTLNVERQMKVDCVETRC